MIKQTFATTRLIIFLGLFLLSCKNQESENKQPTTINNQIDQLSSEELEAFKYSIIRYVGRKPEDASHENKFHTYFDEHYLKQVQQHNLEFFYRKDERQYFILSRIAPSVQLKLVAIGGYVILDENKQVVEIEEVFRTWKHTPDELKSINETLFPLMVQEEDLSPYYTNSMGLDAYIEFPNDEVWYDKTTNTWLSSREDVLKEFYDEKVKRTQTKIDSLYQQ